MTVQTSTSAQPQHIEASSTGQGHLEGKQWWPSGTHRGTAGHRCSIKRTQKGITETHVQLSTYEEHRRSLKDFTPGIPGPLHHSNRCRAHGFTNIMEQGCQVDGLKTSAPVFHWADFLDTHTHLLVWLSGSGVWAKPALFQFLFQIKSHSSLIKSFTDTVLKQ